MAYRWFDSHLDLAYLGACGRDMAASPDVAGGPDLPGAVTFPPLRAGGVRAALGTIFIEPQDSGSGTTHPNVAYAPGDVHSAHRAALAQLDLYHEWQKQGLVRIGLEGRTVDDEGTSRSSEAGGEPIHLGVLIEGADGVRSPEDVPWWAQRGVVAIGLTWAKSSRYAAGNYVDPASDSGLSDLGRAMVRAMDQTRIGGPGGGVGRSLVHDASHLSDRSVDELFESTDRVVIASHSNSRAIVASRAMVGGAVPVELQEHVDPSARILQRHLSDESIKEIARRGGVIGLNLYSPFIIPGGDRARRATIEEWCDHADHMVQLLGHHRSIGLGSDMDGGFSAARLPEGMDGPQSLEMLAQALACRGWSDAAIHALAWKNWADFWGVGLEPVPGRC